jgi:cytoskeletal protein CcmA (bactofilin family)
VEEGRFSIENSSVTAAANSNGFQRMQKRLFVSNAVRRLVSTSLEIDTRGQLTISPKGSLEGGVSICGSAVVKGKFSGILFCEQTARLFGKGRYRAQLVAKCVLVEREADLFFHFPICTEKLIVQGHLTSAILCRGSIHVQKKGVLEGPSWARAIEVAKYGYYTGNLHIRQDEPKESPRFSFKEFPQLSPNKQQRRIVSGESPI